jgi:hypothetical protein
MLVSDGRTIVASANAGCAGGVLTGAHDGARTFHCRLITVGPACVGGGAGVGAVGEFEFEQPIANNNMSPQRVRVTIASPSRGYRDLTINYSGVVPAETLKILRKAALNLGNDKAKLALPSRQIALRIRCVMRASAAV